MEWIEEIRSLLAKRDLREVLGLLEQQLVERESDMASILVQSVIGRLSRAEDDLEKGKALMSNAIVERTRLKFETERILNKLRDNTKNIAAPNVLLMAPKPLGVPDLKIEKECLAISQTLSTSPFQLKTPDTKALQLTEISSTLTSFEPICLHFSGHGVEEIPGLHKQGLVFADQLGNPVIPTNTAIVSTLKMVLNRSKRKDNLRCVLLNACHSFELAKEISKLGVYAVGMKDAIPDESAIAFSAGFYKILGQTETDYVFAFENGVNNINIEPTLQRADVPQIYLNGKPAT